jgi:hypothetical protein
MERSAFESPFLDRYTPIGGEPGPSAVVRESPFLNEYSLGEDEVGPLHGDPMSEIADELITELEDAEFTDAIYELVDEASEVRLSETADEVPDAATEARTEQVVRAYLVPLAREMEALADQVAEIADRPADELETAIDELPIAAQPSPAFEHFLDGLRRKLKSVARTAVRFAKKGLVSLAGPLIRRALAVLKKIGPAILEKVVHLALDKVPAQFRPYLQRLADRFGGRVLDKVNSVATTMGSALAGGVKGALEPAPAPPPPSPEASGASALQKELDLELAGSLLGQQSFETEMGAGASSPEARASDPLRELDRARERFVSELAALHDGEDVQPVVEHFLPAVMLAIRAGINLIGRPKVVGFLGDIIGKLIAPLTGKELAPVLGRVVADLGLKTILHAEVGSGSAGGQDARRVAAEALASTVEETVRRVAEMPEHVLAEPLLFEAAVHEAFDAAAAATLPSQVLRAELRESEFPSVWVRLPLRGPKLYRKFGRVFDVTIAPHVAAGVATFDGSSLSTFFRDRLRLADDRAVEARVHLFEAIPRTRLARIARNEGVRGLGSSEPSASSQLHPLHTEAASLLLGAPGLGRETEEEADPTEPRVGERYYYLEIAEAPAKPLGHGSHLHVTLDLHKNQLRVCVYLSEVVAQTIAAALRRRAKAKIELSAIVSELRTVFASVARRIAHGRSRRAFRVVGAHRPQHAHSPAVRAALHVLRGEVGSRALAWAWVAIAKHLEAAPADFLQMADRPEDGVRILVTFDPVPRAADLARAFSGDLSRAVSLAHEPHPQATVRMFSGPRHHG